MHHNQLRRYTKIRRKINENKDITDFDDFEVVSTTAVRLYKGRRLQRKLRRDTWS